MRVKTSEYNFLFKGPRGLTHLFNACTTALVTLDVHAEHAYSALLEGRPIDDAYLAQFLRGRFAVPVEDDERSWVRASYYAARFSQQGLGLTIAPTLACNFACEYCFEDPNGDAEMDGQTIEDICRFVTVMARKVRRVGVTWYGGEPTLRMDIVRSLSGRLRAICQEGGLDYGAGMITNGYLLDKLTEQDFRDLALGSVQVTLDGPRDVHNSRRRLQDGGDTYDRILMNIKRIAASRLCRVSVRVNVDKLNIDHVRPLLIRLKEHGLHEYSSVIVNLAPVHALSAFCRNIDHHCLTSSEYALVEPELYLKAAELGFAYACYPSVSWGTCGATRLHAYVIEPNGYLQKCWNTLGHTDKRVGHISELELAEPLLYTKPSPLHRWITWDPLQTQCMACGYFPLCQGGCPFKALYPDEVQPTSSTQCSRWRFNLETALTRFLECKARGLRTLVLRGCPAGKTKCSGKEVPA